MSDSCVCQVLGSHLSYKVISWAVLFIQGFLYAVFGSRLAGVRLALRFFFLLNIAVCYMGYEFFASTAQASGWGQERQQCVTQFSVLTGVQIQSFKWLLTVHTIQFMKESCIRRILPKSGYLIPPLSYLKRAIKLMVKDILPWKHGDV